MPMKGLAKSSSFNPVARSRLRCPARSMPFFTVSERMGDSWKSSYPGSRTASPWMAIDESSYSF